MYHPKAWGSLTIRLGRFQIIVSTRMDWVLCWRDPRVHRGSDWYQVGPAGLSVWDREKGEA